MTNSKFYSLKEFRNKMYDDLKVSKQDLVILLCAMLIASIGLNMNSTPVIIGAMLISPLMTPIIGIGFALSILDSELLKKACMLLLMQAILSVTASTIYFFISPISHASSEIIARTFPTIWDVVIAFVGGVAGIIGARKKEANNIVSGVAIATALMPPVCTVGYSIATGNIKFLLGASYLFLINCSFIIIATFIGVRLMMINKHYFKNNRGVYKMRKILLLIAVIVMIPSLVSATGLVRETMKEESLSRFLSDQFKEHTILSKSYNKEKNTLKLTVSGKQLTKTDLEKIYSQQDEYGLKGTTITISQLSNLDELNKEEMLNYLIKYIDERDSQIRDIEERTADSQNDEEVEE